MNNEQEKVEPASEEDNLIYHGIAENYKSVTQQKKVEPVATVKKEVEMVGGEFTILDAVIPEGTELFTTPQPCPDCSARANGASVLVPSAELKKMQGEIERLTEDKRTLTYTYNQLFEAVEGAQETIAQQAERIKTLEVENACLSKSALACAEQLTAAESDVISLRKTLQDIVEAQRLRDYQMMNVYIAEYRDSQTAHKEGNKCSLIS